MMNSGERGSGGGSAGVRRRPPTAPYGASSASYGTSNEEETSPLLSHDVDGYPVLQSYAARRRGYGNGGYGPWWQQPQKLILVAGLCWMGSVMYLASLAHAILRTHKEATRPMGSSMIDNDEEFKEWLESQGMLKKAYGSSASGSSRIDENEDFKEWLQDQGMLAKAYGASSKASDEHVQKWLESRGNGKYGFSGENNNDVQQWLENQKNQANTNKYGASGESKNDEDYQQWLESQANKYGSSSEKKEDFKQWLESQAEKYGASASSSSGSSSSSSGSGTIGKGDAWSDWVAETTQNSGYQASGSSGKTSINSGKTSDVNVRFGSGDALMQEWVDYQNNNKEVKKYNANRMYDESQVNKLASTRKAQAQAQATSDQPQLAVATSDSSISTICPPCRCTREGE